MSDYFISTAAQQMLVELLREIPELIEDLSVTLTRQDRTGKGGMKISSGSDEQPLPLNMAASDAKDELHAELATWARHVCDSRGIAYDGDGSVLGIARWLDENVISLAMTEGSEEAYVGIEKAMGRCRRAMDIAPEDAVITESKDAVLGRVRDRMLHRSAIVEVATELARQYPEYAGITLGRVDALRKGKHIVSDRCGVLSQAEVFEMGKVIDAHLSVPMRAKKVAA